MNHLDITFEESNENAKLRTGTDQKTLGVGNERSKVGHSTNTQEDERGIPTLLYTLVEDVEYRALFVETYLQTGIHIEGNVTDEHTKADRNKEHRLKFLRHGEVYEEYTDGNHGKVLPCSVVYTGICPEVAEVLN